MGRPDMSARELSLHLRRVAERIATARPAPRRRPRDEGSAPAPADHGPKPLPVTGGAEAEIE